MENQHRSIKGYRELSKDEIDFMNSVKELANEVGAMVEFLQRLETVDQRWLAIGKTELQQGFMAIIRGIAQPDSF